MNECLDIRDDCNLHHDDVVHLNFIQDESGWIFRRFHRQGLRSQILEMLRPDDVDRERSGIVREGIRHYPRARPRWILRIFRRRFAHIEEAYREARKIGIVASFLTPEQFAHSNEFLVEYHRKDTRQIVLCGLQEYVIGVGLDPWGPLDRNHWQAALAPLDRRKAHRDSEYDFARHFENMRRQVEGFIDAVKRMIHEAGYIPDLAGRRNLLVSVDGRVHLVDINNLNPIERSDTIMVDDIGYPMCDKSVEALFRLEKYLLHKKKLKADPLYRHFLEPGRMRAVAAIDRRFHQQHA